MNRRQFLRTAVMGSALLAQANAALQKTKIKRIRYYASPLTRPMINQSFHVVTIETDQGLTGIGEGGHPDTIKECAAMLIGENPLQIEKLWQLMYRGFFYPAGREKIHSIGALDLALWDLKGKALGVPVHQLIGGLNREHIECYSTGFPNKGTLKETARACVEAGFRAYRTAVMDPGRDGSAAKPFQSHEMVQRTAEMCRQIREGVGKPGGWAIDYHTRLDFADAVRLSSLIEGLEPYFVEDLVRSENPGVYRQLRPMVKVPIAVGEQYGPRWDCNELIENRLIDYLRNSIPNCGGLTEYLKLAAVCETHYVGLTPHFTGPISEAALVHACGTFSGPVLMEMTGAGPQDIPYLPQHYDFRNGKLWPNERPGLGVTFEPKGLPVLAEVTEHATPIPLFHRPDGSLTNW